MYMSAARCCTAAKEPIGAPNCSRCFTYPAVISRAFSQAPLAHAALSVRNEAGPPGGMLKSLLLS